MRLLLALLAPCLAAGCALPRAAGCGYPAAKAGKTADDDRRAGSCAGPGGINAEGYSGRVGAGVRWGRGAGLVAVHGAASRTLEGLHAPVYAGVTGRAALGVGLADRDGVSPAGLAEAGVALVAGLHAPGGGAALYGRAGAEGSASPAGVAYGPSLGAGVWLLGMLYAERVWVPTAQGFTRWEMGLGVPLLAPGSSGATVGLHATLHRDRATGRPLAGAGVGVAATF